MAARDLGMDRVEIRRRNLIAADQFPYRTPTGNIYDSGNYQGVLETILEPRPVRALGRRARQGARRGPPRRHRRHRVERAQASSARPSSGSGSTSRSSRRRRAPRARASRSTRPGRSSSRSTRSAWGNSPETVVSQVVAEEFDVDPASVVVTYADSQHALPAPARAAPLHGHGLRGGRRRCGRGEGEDQGHRLPQARGERRRSRVRGRRGRRRRLAGTEALAGRDRPYRLHVPARPTSGGRQRARRAIHYDHPLTTVPDDRLDLGIFYPFVGHAWHIGVVEVDVETGSSSSSTTPPSTTRARSSTRRR